MKPEQRLEGIAHNTLADVLGRIDHWMILSERKQVANAVLAAVRPEIERQVREQVAKAIKARRDEVAGAEGATLGDERAIAGALGAYDSSARIALGGGS